MRAWWALLLVAAAVSTAAFDITRSLSTKTPYFPHASAADNEPPPAGCTLSHMELVARHGSRYPTSAGAFTDLEKDLRAMEDSGVTFHDKFAPLLGWVTPHAWAYGDGLLIPRGEEEHYHLARRLVAAYPEVLAADIPDNQGSALYPFQTTQKPRAARSATSFGFGLMQGRGVLGCDHYNAAYQYSESTDQDYTLRFFDNCAAYTEWKHGGSRDEMHKYDATGLTNVEADVLERIVASGAATLSSGGLIGMWEACQYGVLLNDSNILWCDVFSEANIAQINYREDIKLWWERGYGKALNYEIATELVGEIMDNLASAVRGESPTRAKLRFAHAETVLPVMAVLGLYKDDFELRADTPPDKWATRLYQSSYICPMATNIVFNLYTCANNEHVVKVLHNEGDAPVDGKVYWAWEDFVARMAHETSIDFTRVCGNESACGSKRDVSVAGAVGLAFGMLLAGALAAFIFTHVRSGRAQKEEGGGLLN